MKTPTAKALFLLCAIGLFLFFAYYILASFDTENKKEQIEIQTDTIPVPTREPAVFLESEELASEEIAPKEPVLNENIVPVKEETAVIAQNELSVEDTLVKTDRGVKRGVYIPYGVFNSPAGRARIVSMLDTTRINTLVIDVKDSSGYIYIPMIDDRYSFAVRPYSTNALEFLQTLKARGVYLVARVVVFQDPLLSAHMPEYALKSKDGSTWKDFKGLSFLDPQNIFVWEYTRDISTSAYALGFDEINFDYIRYPSDGRIPEIVYNIKEGSSKSDMLEDFFKYLMFQLKVQRGIPLSADIFGETVRLKGDPGIGQVFEKTLPYFDAVAPMVYPSHFSSGSYGIADPDTHPKEIMEGIAGDTYKRFYDWCDTLSDDKNNTGACDYSKNSPWIQDFSIKSTYGVKEVKDQIDALEALGIDSWFVWNASGRYTLDALK